MTTSKLDLLKERVERLERTIVHEDARDYLVRLPKTLLGDVERNAAPGIETFMLPRIAQLLKHAEELVAKYGPKLRIVG